MAAAVVMGLGLAGCAGDGAASAKAAPPDPALKREGQTLFGRPPAPGGDGTAGSDQAGQGSWSIVLAAFRGEAQAQQASATLMEVRSRMGLPQAFSEVRGENTVIAVGSFADPASKEAQAELERIWAISVNGEQPFIGAFLAPPYTLDLGSRPEHNLLKAKELYGEDALYTLQVGAYGGKNLWEPATEAEMKQARLDAEEVVAILRREGEQAFYYHGPNHSMVTVGVFDLADFDPQTPSYQSRRLIEAKKRFPHNLYNGSGLRVTRKGQAPRMTPSMLVAIPKGPSADGEGR